MTEQLLTLAEATAALKEEITNAVAQKHGDIAFKLGNIELEFTVVAKRTGGVSGKVEFKVLGLGPTAEIQGDISSEKTHKVKFTLIPQTSSGGELEIRRGDV